MSGYDHPTERRRRIAQALEDAPHITETFATAGRCSLAEATVDLLRLEREGRAERGPKSAYGMTWRSASHSGAGRD